MNASHRFNFDIPLLFITIILTALGVLFVFSSSSYVAGDKYGQPFYFMVQQLMGAGAGLAALAILICIKRTFFLEQTFVYALLGLTVGMLMLCFLMPTVAHTNRWLVLMGFRFQPSELAKVSIILFLAFYCEKYKDRLNELKTLAIPAVALGVVVILVLMEPDFGTAILIALLGCMILFIAGVKLRYFAVVGAAFALIFAFTIFRADYRIERVQGFLSAEKDNLGSGYQANQSKLAVGAGGIIGVGLGQSVQKLYFLPFAHTDFIYAILGEEFGMIGTVGVLLLFMGLLWRGLKIAFSAPSPKYRMTAAGLTLAITVQALLNMTIVLGMGPTKGIPLPFISYGRSSLVCTLLTVGLLLHISQKRAGAAR